jgi:L-seryl-tRNA(Ser) seleniumtransferase
VALAAPRGDADALLAALRGGDPPLVGRIADGRVLLDPRTLPGRDLEDAAAAVRAVADGS